MAQDNNTLPRQRVTAVCGMIAPVWFLFALLAFGALRPEYSHATKAVSELGAWGAPNALAWNVLGFGVVGALVMVFAWGLWNATSSWPAALFVGLSGLGFAAAGAFPADLNDLEALSTKLHILASLASFGAFACGVFVVGWVFWQRPSWRRWAYVSLAVGVLGIVSVLLQATEMPPGLVQRITFLSYLLWVAVLGAAVWKVPKSE